MDISFYLKRPEAIVETVIFARIRYADKELKYYLPEKVNPKYWSKTTQRVIKTAKFPEYPEFNTRLDNFLTEIKTVYRKYLNDNNSIEPSTRELKDILDKKYKSKEDDTPRNLFSFFQKIILLSTTGARLNPKDNAPIAIRTIKSYKTTLKHLQTFANKKRKSIDFDEIDIDFYEDFLSFLQKDLRLTNNALGVHIKNLKTVMGEAVERGLTNNYSFRNKKFKTVREDTDSIYLNREELQELERLDLSSKPGLERVRDLFLIGCYTGLRYSDYTTLKPENIINNQIEISQTKTGGRVVIPIHPTVNRILKKYDNKLPVPITNQKSNKYLKEIGQQCEGLKKTVSRSYTKAGKKVIINLEKWELLTTHTGRRSMATNEYKAGTPSITIMAITGHKSEKTFLKYIKVTPDEHSKLMQKMWQDRGEYLSLVK